MNTDSNRKAACYFSLNDRLTERVSLIHREYTDEVQAHFQGLFPARQCVIIQDESDCPLPVDLAVMYPTEEEPFYLVYTLGMSAAPMKYPASPEMPEGRESYGELCIMLPADWPIEKNGQIDVSAQHNWPLAMLRSLAKFPHVHQLWMSYGFVLPNSENGETFAPDTELSGVLIVQFEGELGELHMADGAVVQILMPVLLYKDELDLYDEIGPDTLLDHILDCTDGSFMLNVKRPDTATLTGF